MYFPNSTTEPRSIDPKILLDSQVINRLSTSWEFDFALKREQGVKTHINMKKSKNWQGIMWVDSVLRWVFECELIYKLGLRPIN